MKLGIAISTTPNINRNIDIESFINFMTSGTEYNIVICEDTKLVGAPSSKNISMKYLYESGCDFILLLDDDCYPRNHGFDRYLMDNMIKYKKNIIHHPNVFNDKLISFNEELTYWNGALGSMLSLSRKHIEDVGYFNTKYLKYGYTDPPFTYRSKLFYKESSYPSLLRVPFFFMSVDLYVQQRMESVYTVEQKRNFIKNNDSIYLDEIRAADKGAIYCKYSNKDESSFKLTHYDGIK